MIPWNNVQLSLEVKLTKRKKEPKFGPNGLKSDQKLGFMLLFQVQFISFPGNWIG